MHFIADFLIRGIIRTRLFNDYLGSLTNTPVIQRLLGCLTITAEQNASIRAKSTKPRHRITLQRGSLMCRNRRKALYQAVLGIEKCHHNSIKITVDLWRRARDSNPRNAFDVYTISNRAPSTSSDNSPCLQSNARLLYMTAPQKSSLFSKILNFLFLHSTLIE